MVTVLDASLIEVFWPADGGDARLDPGAVGVRWAAPPGLPADRLFQVYLNGELAGATGDPDEQELIVPADPSGEAASIAAAVVAVGPGHGGDDHSAVLDPQQCGGRALLRWPRPGSADPAATVNVYGNGGSGAIDYGTPLNDRPIAMFPDGSGRWGFGLGGFGGDDFGRGGGRSPGWGLGGFGVGEFGVDSAWARWLSGPLGPGAHRLAAVARDGLGNADESPPVEVDLTIVDPPAPIASAAITDDAGRMGIELVASD